MICKVSEVLGTMLLTCSLLGKTGHKESAFRIPYRKKMKPDLVAYGIGHMLVIDAQVTNDQLPLVTAHETSKYEF